MENKLLFCIAAVITLPLLLLFDLLRVVKLRVWMQAITDIIATNPKKVERILGRAEKIERVNLKLPFTPIRAYYRKGAIEIIYMDNLSDWIVVHNQERRLIEEFIGFLGLRLSVHTFQYRGVVKYYGISGLAQVAFYGTYQGEIDQLHIKTFTKLHE